MWKPFAPLVHEDLLVNPNNRGLANAVVFLRPDSDDRKAAFPADKIHPRPRGRKARRANRRRRPRAVYAARARRAHRRHRPVRQPAAGADERALRHRGAERAAVQRADRQGHVAHDEAARGNDASRTATSRTFTTWMNGYVWTFDHPYAATTDADGKFEIKNAPAGKWRLVVWHETRRLPRRRGRAGSARR